MQMSNPSPLRDPHANRPNEPKDYNILNPLNADGSNFACKGYQWNTPWTPVTTYEAGGTYNMSIIGGATHGGGSCQLSFSCDGGVNFKVAKSIIGGCPLQSQYPFTVPVELGRLGRTTCLFAWTWFNKVGNREMYMNCAVVNIVPRGTRTSSSKPSPSQHLTVRDTAKVNAAAQAALASYPDLFVANLAGINNCVAPETYDVVFGDPGRAVQFGDNVGAASKPTFQRNTCTGKGHTSAGASSGSALSPPPPSSSVSSTGGDDGQWHGGDSRQQQSSTASSSTVTGKDRKYNPSIHGSTTGEKTPSPSLALQQNSLQPVDVQQGNKQPDAQVQKELKAYLARLYGTKAAKQQRAACTTEADDAKDAPILANTLTRTRRQKRWSSYQSLNPEENNSEDTSSNAQATAESGLSMKTDEDNSVAPPQPPPQSIDATFAAFLQRLNSLSNSLFTLVKFASSYLDQAPPDGYYGTTGTTTGDADDSDAEPSDAAFTTAKQYIKRSSPSLPAHGEETSDTPSPNTQALRQWLQELKAQIVAMKSYTQSTAARLGAKNDTLLRRQSRPVGRPFDWASLYPSLKMNSSGTEEGPGVASVGGQQTVSPMNTTTTTTTTTTMEDSTVAHSNTTGTTMANVPSTTATAAKDSWKDGVFPFLLAPHPSPSSSLSPAADSDAAALFPFIMAPGPVLPSGVNVDGGDNLEHMPVVIDDLGDGGEAEDGVRKFFEGLRGGSGGGGGGE
ncbi:hypothetical protein HRS9139_00823 [Pyrenophora teres f. teres]|nr:hypothetical protein HRS9139_00823 [Pyrenophora teres f. teres]